MKKIIVSLLALVTVTISAQAQTRRNNSNGIQDSTQNKQKDKLKQFKKEQHGKRKMDVAKRMEKMKEKLALSDEQVAKLTEQREAFKSKFETIKNNQSLSMDDKKAQMKALREERKNSFRSILTPDQVKKMEEMKQKRTGKAA